MPNEVSAILIGLLRSRQSDTPTIVNRRVELCETSSLAACPVSRG